MGKVLKCLTLVAALMCGAVLASPALYTGAVKMGAEEWNSDFSRAQGLIPLGAQILSAERQGTAVVVRFAFDPESEYVWRRIIMTRGIHPIPVPLDRFIGEEDGVYFWDEGQFTQPL